MIDADAIAKKMLELPEVRRDVAAAFGDVETAGRIDHRKLAAAAFRSPSDVTKLNAIVHPHVAHAIDRQVGTWAAEGFRGLVIVDAALLLEAGMRNAVDELVFVEVPDDLRRERARARGWAEGEMERRERLQIPLEEKKKACGETVWNGGTVEEMDHLVAGIAARMEKKNAPVRR